MMGNVWEWTETLYDSYNRNMRGGSYYFPYGDDSLSSPYRIANAPYDDGSDTNRRYDIGFRVASIPEPVSLLLLTLGGLLIRKR